MNKNIHKLPTAKVPPRSRNTGYGEEPPRGDDLERRVEVLEKCFSRIEEALARIEKNTIKTEERLNTIETHFATKAELKEAQSDLNKNILDLRTEFKQGISNTEIKIANSKYTIIACVITANITLLGLVAAVASYFKP